MSEISLSTVVDFYCLQAAQFKIMCADIASGEDSENLNVPARVLESRVNSEFTRITDMLATCFRDYAFLAAYGESRHAWSLSNGEVPSDLPRGDRRDAVDSAMTYSPQANWESLYKVFEDNTWSSSYGGRAWARIARAIKLYGVNKAVFVDHICDLKHNGGSLFDKSYCLRATGLTCDMSEWALNSFLNFKRDKDILENLDDEMLQFASVKVLDICVDVMRIFCHVNPAVVPQCIVDSRDDYEGIEWGEEVFSDEWVDTESYHCEHCGDSIDPDDCYTSEAGDIYCEYCYSEHFSHCNECDAEISSDDSKDYDGYSYCESCYDEKFFECEWCGDAIEKDDALITDDDVILCDSCWNNHASHCDVCDKTVYYDDDFVMGVCEDCQEQSEPCEVCGESALMSSTGHFVHEGHCTDVLTGDMPGQLNFLEVLNVY